MFYGFFYQLFSAGEKVESEWIFFQIFEEQRNFIPPHENLLNTFHFCWIPFFCVDSIFFKVPFFLFWNCRFSFHVVNRFINKIQHCRFLLTFIKSWIESYSEHTFFVKIVYFTKMYLLKPQMVFDRLMFRICVSEKMKPSPKNMLKITKCICR